MRQSRARAQHNRARRSAIRTALKKARTELTREAVEHAVQMLDRGAGKGQIHRNAAARKKSRLMRKLAKQR
jgi:small subunit ribosomal protein S20